MDIKCKKCKRILKYFYETNAPCFYDYILPEKRGEYMEWMAGFMEVLDS